MINNTAIKNAVAYLISKGVVKNQTDIAQSMGYSRASVSSAINGNSEYLTTRFLQRFNRAFGNIFNFEYLQTGEGEMLARGTANVSLSAVGNHNNNAINYANTSASDAATNTEDLKNHIATLQQQNTFLQEQIKALNAVILELAQRK